MGQNNLLANVDPNGKSIIPITVILSWGITNIKNTWDVFWDFALQKDRNGETDSRYYDENHPSSKAMRETIVAKLMRKDYKDKGCQDVRGGINSYLAAAETFLLFNNIIQIQVGAFNYETKTKQIDSGNRKEVTYILINNLTVKSLFYHAIEGELPRGKQTLPGTNIKAMGKLQQIFTWREFYKCCSDYSWWTGCEK